MEEIDTIDYDQFGLVLTPETDLDAKFVGPLQEQFIKDMHDINGVDVLLDLQKTDTIDSSGVSLVVGLMKECQSKNCQLHVVLASSFIAKVFEMVRLQDYITFYKMKMAN